MKTVIIYGSCYGTSERYARELARQTGAELHAAKDLRDLTGCGLAVHIGGLYAGGLAGLRQTLRLLPPDCWLMAVTVGWRTLPFLRMCAISGPRWTGRSRRMCGNAPCSTTSGAASATTG